MHAMHVKHASNSHLKLFHFIESARSRNKSLRPSSRANQIQRSCFKSRRQSTEVLYIHRYAYVYLHENCRYCIFVCLYAYDGRHIAQLKLYMN